MAKKQDSELFGMPLPLAIPLLVGGFFVGQVLYRQAKSRIVDSAKKTTPARRPSHLYRLYWREKAIGDFSTLEDAQLAARDLVTQLPQSKLPQWTRSEAGALGAHSYHSDGNLRIDVSLYPTV